MRRFHLSLLTIITVALAALISGSSRAADPLPGSVVSFDVDKSWPSTTPGQVHVVCNPDLRDLGNYDAYQWNADKRYLIGLYDQRLDRSAYAIVNTRDSAHLAAKDAIWPDVPKGDITGFGHPLDSRGRLGDIQPNSRYFNDDHPSSVGEKRSITDPELLERMRQATLRANNAGPCDPCDPCKKLKRTSMDRMTGRGPLADQVRARIDARGGAYFPRQSWVGRGVGGGTAVVSLVSSAGAYQRGGPRAALADFSWPLSESPLYRFLDQLNASRGKDGCSAANDAMDHAFSGGNGPFDPRHAFGNPFGMRPPAPLNTDLGWGVPLHAWDR